MEGTNGGGSIQERGFEAGGEFYPWHLTDCGKDLMLIDRITGGMLPHEFFDSVSDPHEQFRGPILLGLMGTSVRNRHPEWSIERILRFVNEVKLGDIEFLGGEDEETVEEAVSEQLPPSDDAEDSSESAKKPSESAVTRSKKQSVTQD
jgi:hypothetical protein